MERHRPSNRRQGEPQLRSIEFVEHGRNSRRSSGAQDKVGDFDLETVGRQSLPNPPPLSGDDEYVRRWLAKADAELDEKDIRKLKQSRSSPSKYRTSPIFPVATSIRLLTSPPFHTERKDDARAHRDVEMILQGPQVARESRKARKRKRRPNSSSDSSLLDTPRRQRLRMSVQDAVSLAPTRQSEPLDQQHRKHKVDLSDSEVQQQYIAPSSPQRETFEKRSRHKTREDRYEPKSKGNQSHEAGEKKRSRSKKVKKSSQKKARKKAGEDLMHNFSSNSIGRERLTIRPAHGPGLFMNGRASSPARRRGVPDLAFSEMDFLQHFNPRPPTTQEEKTRSQSREKERKKATKVQDEISTFFGSNRAPLHESRPQMHQTYSEYTKAEPRICGNQIVSGQGHTHSRSQSFDFHEKPCLGFENQEPLSGRKFHVLSAKENVAGSGRQSDVATSRFSWSETQLSPGATATRRRTSNAVPARSSISPTPDPIRRSIEETGIFRDTGIRKPVLLNHFRARDSPLGTIPQKLTRGGNGSAAVEIYTSAATPRKNEEDRSRVTVLGPRNQAEYGIQFQRPSSPRSDPKQTAKGSLVVRAGNSSIDDVEKGSTARNLRTEHFDPKFGWHSRPASVEQHAGSPASAVRSEPLQKMTITPVSREQIAKNARIKRPLTAVPLTGDTNSAGQKALDEDHLDAKLPRETLHNRQVQVTPQDGEKKINPLILPNIPAHSNSYSIPLVMGDTSSHANMQRLPNSNTNSVNHLQSDVAKTQAACLTEHQSRDSILTGLEKQTAGFNKHSLPVRGSWIDGGSMQSTHLRQLSPVIEIRPLFTHQMQPPIMYERPIYAETNRPKQALKEDFELLAGQLEPTTEDLSCNHLDEKHYWELDAEAEALDRNGYDAQEELETHAIGEIFGAEWQYGQQGHYHDQGFLEPWNGNGHMPFSQQYGLDDLNVGSTYAQASPMLDEDGMQGGGGMQGFWRPYRQY